MAKSPLILMTACKEAKGVEFRDTSVSLSHLYAQALVLAGGTPWILPSLPSAAVAKRSVELCDGVMLTGGDDLQPSLYAESLPNQLSRTVAGVDPERDYLETLLIREVFRQRKPLLAICRGQQILNVALGGSLIVDIATQFPQALNHRRMDRKDRIVHSIELAPGSRIRRVFGRSRLGVNSSHHQAVDRIASPLKPTAWSSDGVVEAMELDDKVKDMLPYLLAVQFHPERLLRRQPVFGRLFGSFVQAAKGSKNHS